MSNGTKDVRGFDKGLAYLERHSHRRICVSRVSRTPGQEPVVRFVGWTQKPHRLQPLVNKAARWRPAADAVYDYVCVWGYAGGYGPHLSVDEQGNPNA